MKKQFSSKANRLATLAVLCASSLIAFIIENLFPPLILPGAKMGVANVFSTLALFLLDPTDAFVVVIVRTTLGCLFGGGMSALAYSLTAGLASMCVASILRLWLYPSVSIVAISVASAVVHNVVQNLVFCITSSTWQMIVYMPWLALLGVLAGIVVGFAVWLILRSLPLSFLSRFVVDSSAESGESIE